MLASETVEMKWSYNNRKHFESLGYHFTNINDVFTVNVKHLTNGSPVRIMLKCDYCGKEYDCYYYAYVKSHAVLQKDACHSCATAKGKEANKTKRARKYFAKLRELCDERGYTLITKEDEYTDIYMNIEYICPKHGFSTSILSNMLRGHMCNGCGNEKIGEALRNDIKYVKEYIESFNNNVLLNPEDYTNSGTCNLHIRCGICGNIFTTSLNVYRNSRKQCRACTKRESEGEEIIRMFLINKDICFTQEKRFDDCRDKHPLPFDFYLPDYNMCIEFDGEQHYRPIYGQDRFEKTVLHDKIKSEYCKDNNIHLLRIPYLNGHSIEDIINNELNRIKI